MGETVDQVIRQLRKKLGDNGERPKQILTVHGVGCYKLRMLWVERGRVSWSPPRRGGFGVATLSGVLIAAAILMTCLLAKSLGWLDPEQIAERARQTGLSNLGLYLTGALYWITLLAQGPIHAHPWRTILRGRSRITEAAPRIRPEPIL